MQNKTVLIGALLLPLTLSLGAQAAPGGGKLERFLTPEQRAMFVMQARDQVKDMAPDERKTFRHDQVARLMAMPGSERDKLKADLQAIWDALPQARKDKIEQRIAMRQQQPQQPMNPNQGTAVVK